jgi:hypothetical protein
MCIEWVACYFSSRTVSSDMACLSCHKHSCVLHTRPSDIRWHVYPEVSFRITYTDCILVYGHGYWGRSRRVASRVLVVASLDISLLAARNMEIRHVVSDCHAEISWLLPGGGIGTTDKARQRADKQALWFRQNTCRNTNRQQKRLTTKSKHRAEDLC